MIVLTSLLHWRHSERDGVLNHRRLDCLLTVYSSASKVRVTDRYDGKPPVVTGGFPSQGPVTRQMIPSDDVYMPSTYSILWWQHDMETRSALLDICDGNPSVPSGFHSMC